jgi:hypothetical protein
LLHKPLEKQVLQSKQAQSLRPWLEQSVHITLSQDVQRKSPLQPLQFNRRQSTRRLSAWQRLQ